MNKQLLCFDDVLIEPQFSSINSRAEVSLSQNFCGIEMSLPVISSNMDTVTGTEMAHAMANYGAISSLHRFMTIDENVKQFQKATEVPYGAPTRGFKLIKPIVSVGLGTKELERTKALSDAGAEVFLVDVAHGASMAVVEQVYQMGKLLSREHKIIVGNFATARSVQDFLFHLGDNSLVSAIKVGIGGGSACLTRIVTGCGMPTLASVLDCARTGIPIIADGGCKNSGDIAKALAAGASTVMLGGMLAGTDESPGVITDKNGYEFKLNKFEILKNNKGNYVPGYQQDTILYKKYRGSASTESYEVQGKVAKHRSYEGDSFLVPYKGSVEGVLQQIEGGLRSALSYVGANNLEEFREFAELVQITGASIKENSAHGKNHA